MRWVQPRRSLACLAKAPAAEEDPSHDLVRPAAPVAPTAPSQAHWQITHSSQHHAFLAVAEAAAELLIEIQDVSNVRLKNLAREINVLHGMSGVDHGERLDLTPEHVQALWAMADVAATFRDQMAAIARHKGGAHKAVRQRLIADMKESVVLMFRALVAVADTLPDDPPWFQRMVDTLNQIGRVA